MCGIVALITNFRNGFDQSQVDAFSNMLYVNALRGTDSTGVFYVNNKEDVQIHKDITESGPFLKTKEWESSKNELYKNGLAVIGHCRAKTRGANKDENAHPFNVDNKIILVHNGTFIGDHKHLADTEVDSHAIAHVLAEEKDIAKALNKVNAAYALIWYNRETRTMHAIRNKERTLYYAKTKDGAMLLASESSFIYMACWRNGLMLDDKGCQMLPEHQLMSVELDGAFSREYTFEDIDAGYKYQYQYQPPKANPVTVVSPITQETGGGKVVTLDPERLKAWRAKSRYTMLEAANDLEIGEYEYNGGEGFRGWLKRDAEVVIEATDYFKVDQLDANDQNYFIFGHIMAPGQKEDGFLACWEIVAPDEKSVIDYAGCDFPYFQARIEHGMIRDWNLPNGEKIRRALFKVNSVTNCSTVPEGVEH